MLDWLPDKLGRPTVWQRIVMAGKMFGEETRLWMEEQLIRG